MKLDQLALPFIITSSCLLLACGGSNSSAPATSSETPPTVVAELVSPQKLSAPALDIAIEGGQAIISWAKQSNADYELYWAYDASLDTNNYGAIGGDVIIDAQSPVNLNLTNGEPLFIRMKANGNGSEVLGETHLLAQFNPRATSNTGQHLVKLDANGHLLPDTASEWPCVLDTVTGLIWQTDADQATKRYVWNEDNRFQGDSGLGICDSYVAEQCTTQKLIETVSQTGVCGSSEWRLPKVLELQSLVDLNRSLPAINTDYFPNTQIGHYWAQEIFVQNNDYAWNVSFDYGHASVNTSDASMTDLGYVRLVTTSEQNVFNTQQS